MGHIIRTYSVWTVRSSSDNKIKAFHVTDQLTDTKSRELDSDRKEVAVFPVSQLYDEHSQRMRAQLYSDYMNKINEATIRSYERHKLMDMIKDE